MEYDIRKGHYSKLEGNGLKEIMTMAFGNAKAEGDMMVSSYGAITRVEAKVVSKSALEVSSETDKTAPVDVQADTIKHWNVFLESATGFTSKERSKRLQKKAKEGKL
ncbi:MAG: DUF5611 family protein [Methanomassiliicoccales archaeon]|jgi:hypothetical protein|nr:DUF5611 family protein [Methanomassiliicoccales archaeon]